MRPARIALLALLPALSALAALLPTGLHAEPAPSLAPGDTALLFSLPALNEDAALHMVAKTHVALSDMTGVSPGFPAKAVIVTFANAATPDSLYTGVERLYRKYSNRGARFVIIVSDNIEIAALSDRVGNLKLSYPVLHDRYRVVSSRYGVQAWPMTFVVNMDGDVDAIGMVKADFETAMDAILTDVLAQ